MPDDLAPDELTIDKAAELLENPSSDRVLGKTRSQASRSLLRGGRYGPDVQLGEAAEEAEKPRTASLLKNDERGEGHPRGGSAALAAAAERRCRSRDSARRSSPQRPLRAVFESGNENASLETEDQLFTVTTQDAIGLFAEPKQRRYGTSAAPLRELGTVSGAGLRRRAAFGPSAPM